MEATPLTNAIKRRLGGSQLMRRKAGRRGSDTLGSATRMILIGYRFWECFYRVWYIKFS